MQHRYKARISKNWGAVIIGICIFIIGLAAVAGINQYTSGRAAASPSAFQQARAIYVVM